ncbi:dienelactone hydrolase family protein [Phenylobacterium terrae]|uniref:Dienelactone hydrolase family protein n=1 Tax=Phenylobacterium terrae TaxID=2665495 RepID=A0ABW4N346_9CAUL
MAASAYRGQEEIAIQRVGLPPLAAFLGVPEGAKGVVVFAHGSGSGRNSPRNNHVAEKLREAGFATLLLDLLTPEEERDRGNVFDIRLLASRLEAATDWMMDNPATAGLAVGYFGASTGAGAALVAAAERPREVAAVVSRGGRPDLAQDALPRVAAPTLLIVGGWDEPVIDLNRAARARMTAEVELVIVPEATHLFEEPGALDQVIGHAKAWFLRHLKDIAPKERRHDQPRPDLR